MRHPPIALLTDFGAADVYVGVMKAVIAGIAPLTPVIDLAHEITPGDIHAAAFRLWQAAPWLKRGTVLLAVVDPGVGSARRAVALAFEGLLCVGPDNGVFTFLLQTRACRTAVEITALEFRLPAVSATFHGRDIFAPAAAHLCAGVPMSRLGPAAHDLVLLPLPALRADGGGVQGEVLDIDRFGNAITSIGLLQREEDNLRLDPWLRSGPAERLAGTRFHAELPDGRRVPFARTFGDVTAGAPLAYAESNGLLEIAVNGARASEVLGLARGARVRLVPD